MSVSDSVFPMNQVWWDTATQLEVIHLAFLLTLPIGQSPVVVLPYGHNRYTTAVIKPGSV